MHALLRREGFNVNHKRSSRLYRKMNLHLRRKRRKNLKTFKRDPYTQPIYPNEVWSFDFVHDRLASGRKIRFLTLTDIFTRMCLATEVGYSMGSQELTRILDNLVEFYGKPSRIRIYNGSEMTTQAMDQWVYQNGVQLEFINPGKATENGHSESFNGRFRDEFLEAHWIEDLWDARKISDAWREEVNSERPHSSLGNKTPQEFANSWNSMLTA